MINTVLGFIKPALLILIPFSWVLGMLMKKAVLYEGKSKLALWIGKRLVKATARIKVLLYLADALIAILFGFCFSGMEGWRLFLDAILVYGIHGVVCAAIATKLYDKVREQ